jgi:ParB-like chromosome segregation protein Spo0J
VKQQIEYVETAELIPYARNSRTHSDEQIAQICGSIKEFGFTNPVLIDADGLIIAGHGRTMAAQRLNMKEVPCLRLTHLTDAQKKAYVIADNKLALNAGWDEEMLALELGEINELNFDITKTGFSDDEISFLLGDVNFDAGDESDQGQLDQLDPKIIKCPHCKKEFDARGK